MTFRAVLRGLFVVVLAMAAASASRGEVARAETYSITLTASATSLPVGTAVTLSASATGDLSLLKYGAMEIHRGTDIYTGTGDGVCGADAPKSSCTGQWTAQTPGTSQFIAQVWSMGSGSVVAKSNIVSVTWTAVATPTATASPTSTPTPALAGGPIAGGSNPANPSGGTSPTIGPASGSGGTPWGPVAAVAGGTAAVVGGGLVLRRRRIPSLPGGPTASARPPIIDAEGNPLVVQDGTYGGGGKPGDVWYGGTWVDPTVAERGIIDDRHALEERQHEITTFQAGTDIERGNWLHDVEVESQAAGTANTNAPQAPDVPAVTPAQMDDLGNRFTDSVNEMINAGYTVKNRNPIVAAGNTIRDIESWLVKHFGGEGIDDPRAGRCGEYGQWGIDRSKDFVKDVFGPGAVVDDIVIQQRSIPGSLGEAAGAVAGSAPPGVDQRLYLANHRATHVTLPDGSRYVLDYWDGVATGKPAIVTEQQWLEKWKPTMGGDFRIDRSPGATELRTYINQFGEQRGIDFYRGKTHDELTIRSWQKAPW